MSLLSKAYYKEKGGQLVTPSQYEANNRANDIEYPALCISCNEPLFSYGVNSPNVTECFKHHKATNIIHKCPLHSSSARNGFLDRTPLDIENGMSLRNEFFKKENLLCAYELCHKIKGGKSGCLSQSEFIDIIQAADATGIWNYKGIKLWGIMIILLLKSNYSFSSGIQYYYKFKRKKIRRKCPENEWWNDVILQPCFLENNKEVDEKYKKCIPFSESWYQKQISTRHFKEEHAKIIFSYFKV
ncbi:hypothetical protein A9G17_03025 [Gilliamella sp. wkB7]|uniref:hypothetical protein n=1 Tax=Gilliamella sp. wkB7 TaxID=3120264 RepID=UPI0008104880|nr:hypothetical protein [Gilliamella apicola]OCF92165.1 hypothetical protein A9G17_03025 [Gilliamella apicola]